ncbi:hypothetical protein BJX68DRAFT_268747 [Aspergillus pseudodeflectus]|uniref:Uncharacterized protein n=1 Tax=Aspergillus pseudodeflectus TaxID=176178 RepID=A0ABR4K1S3_9EURO
MLPINAPSHIKETTKFPATFDSALESRIARVLDDAGFSGWVVPDECIDKAKEALDKANLPPCIKGRRCFCYWPKFSPPVPSTGPSLSPRPSWRLFWEFAKPPIGVPPPDDPYYMLVSDPRIKISDRTSVRGRQPEGRYRVKIVIPARYAEAMILLTLRDLRAKVGVNQWHNELSYLLDRTHVLGLNLEVDDIREPYREFARRFGSEEYSEAQNDYLGYGYQYKLWLDLKRRNQLPPAEEPEHKERRSLFSLKNRLKKHKIPYTESDLAFE